MSRILRSTYPDPDLVRLMNRVNQQEWPELEKSCGKKLVHRTGGCLFGPEGGLFDRYAKAVAEAGADVDLLDEKQAASRFPAFNLNGLKALADHTAGLIDATANNRVAQRPDRGERRPNHRTFPSHRYGFFIRTHPD